MKAGYIGLGHIGRGMARDLVTAGHDTIVYDVMPEGPAELAALGATIGASPAAVAGASETMGVCVRSDQDVIDVFTGPDGILAGAAPGLLVAIHSTVRPSTIHAMADAAQAKRVRVVDAPVSRGIPEPDGRHIVYMLGGAEADIAALRPFLAPSAKEIVVAGGLGAAMALKICNNLVTYTEFMAMVEADKLARASGLDPALLIQVMTANGNATPSMQAMIKGRAAAVADPASMATKALAGFVAIAEKDLDCALEVAAEAGLDLPGTTIARSQVAGIFAAGARS